MKVLFIPLKRIYFEQYKLGIKHYEWRRYGPRWNERVCVPGRKVILSCGYSGPRLRGTIRSFKRTDYCTQATRDIYPDCREFAMIGINVT